jgi:hypothetical protein
MAVIMGTTMTLIMGTTMAVIMGTTMTLIWRWCPQTIRAVSMGEVIPVL